MIEIDHMTLGKILIC